VGAQFIGARQHMQSALECIYAIARPSVRPSHGWISQKRLKLWVQSRFSETRFAETLTPNQTPNPKP